MPEGDTVMWAAARLNRALLGQRLTRTDLRTPRLATVDLSGRECLPVVTHGKHMLHRLEGGVTIHSHFKMEGRWSLLPAPSTLQGRAAAGAEADVRRAVTAHTTRALLYTPRTLAVGSKLGVLDVLETAREGDVVGHLGPDLLADDWDGGGRGRALDNLRVQPERPVGEALLDQRLVAGLGTFWISEMLWVHRILPWTQLAAMPDGVLEAVLDDARRLMLVSGRTGVQSSTGDARAGQDRYVHARSGMACLRCNDTIRVAMAGDPGRERTLFSCPTCQGGLAPNDDGRPQGVLRERKKTGKRYKG